MKHLKLFITIFILTFAVSCGQQKRYVTYKVKKGETMRIIAKKLDMKTRDLLRLNPDVGRKPDANTEILIPNKLAVNNKPLEKDIVKEIEEDNFVKKDTVIIVDPIDELKDEFVLHKVSKGDTFYGLTRYYNVLKSDLLELNPELSEGLKLGSVLKIKRIIEGDVVDVIYRDTISNDIDALKVALLLPFRANVFDTIVSQEIFKSGEKKLVNIVTDFYLGAELAIDSLRNQGLQVDLTVFDTERRNTKINEIISENQLKGMDVVIGPVYPEEANKIVNSINAPVIFPVFSKVQSSFRSSRIVKTVPDEKLHKEKLLSHIVEKYTNENIIIVGDSTDVSIREIQQITTILKQHDSINIVHQIIPHAGYIAQDRFLKIMKPDTTNVVNWVILATKNNAIASNAINSLISFPEPEEPEEGEEPEEKINYLVKAFGFEMVKTLGNNKQVVDNNKLAQLGFVYVANTYFDASSTNARIFNKQYLKKNKALPSDYAIRGFDVTYDILMRLAFENDLYDTFKNGVSYRLESKFDYNKRLFGVSENRGLFLLEFNTDLSLKRIE